MLAESLPRELKGRGLPVESLQLLLLSHTA